MVRASAYEESATCRSRSMTTLPSRYEAAAITIHKGGPESGHHVILLRDGLSNRWICRDDAHPGMVVDPNEPHWQRNSTAVLLIATNGPQSPPPPIQPPSQSGVAKTPCQSLLTVSAVSSSSAAPSQTQPHALPPAEPPHPRSRGSTPPPKRLCDTAPSLIDRDSAAVAGMALSPPSTTTVGIAEEVMSVCPRPTADAAPAKRHNQASHGDAKHQRDGDDGDVGEAKLRPSDNDAESLSAELDSVASLTREQFDAKAERELRRPGDRRRRGPKGLSMPRALVHRK